MTLREKWLFTMTVGGVYDGAKAKYDHHQSRIEWWRAKKDEVFAKIKGDGGLKISESLVAQYNKTGYGNAGVGVEVDPELQKQLDECVRKIGEHKVKADSYHAYVEVLANRPKTDTLDLTVDDWQFFFGK